MRNLLPLSSFQYVVTVLDCVTIYSRSKYADKKTAKNYLKQNYHKDFIVLPGSQQWHKLGWNSKKLQAAYVSRQLINYFY